MKISTFFCQIIDNYFIFAFMRRTGNKKELVKYILPFIPSHSTYIEPFFGTGAVFFAKPLAFNNMLNDIDKELYFFYKSISNKEIVNELKNKVQNLLLHRETIKEIYSNHIEAQESAEYALYYTIRVYFTLYDNFFYKVDFYNFKSVFFEKLKLMQERITAPGVSFECLNSISFFEKMTVRHPEISQNTFIYIDSPYPGTYQPYNTQVFTWNDLQNLHDIIFNREKYPLCKVMYSLYGGEDTNYFAKHNKLRIIELRKQKATINHLKNKKERNKNEVILINYELQNKIFF